MFFSFIYFVIIFCGDNVNIEKIYDVVNNGGLVISPTDTVYGIMGDALDENVIKKVYDIKHRSYAKPLIILVSNYDMLKEYTDDISELEEEIINKFLPGLVTIILKKNEKISSLISSGSDYVGVRIPDNDDLIKIIDMLGRPVISTSANISDEDVITNVNMIDERLKKEIDYIEDGGEVISSSSTVIRIINDELVILREGILSDEIRDYFDKK